MDPAAANDGGGIYNFAEIWNGLDSDPMALDQEPTYAPTNQNSKKHLEEDDVSIARLKAVGSNGNRENRRTTEGNSGKSPKQDFIHVRARRGQATDSHSLAERARREKISTRMKTLRDLVPGCNRVIGKALVLDEIINYIQSLQRQVEFLSMKLEAVNARVEINGYPSKDQRFHDASSSMSFGALAFGRGSSPE